MKIPEYYRDKLYYALLGPVDILSRGDSARIILEQIAANQLRDIEPIIEDLLDKVKENKYWD